MQAHPLSVLLAWTQKYIRETSAPDFLSGLVSLLQLIRQQQEKTKDQENLSVYEQRIFCYLLFHSSKKTWDDIAFKLEQAKLNQEEQYMISAAQQLIEKGVLEGFSQGQSEGLFQGLSQGPSEGFLQGKEAVVQTMCHKGFSLECIVDFTGLPLQQVVSITQKMKPLEEKTAMKFLFNEEKRSKGFSEEDLPLSP